MKLNYILCNPVTTFSKLLTVILNCVQQEKQKRDSSSAFLVFPSQEGNKESQNHEGKEFLSLSPTINPTLPGSPLSHVPKHQMHVVLEHFQG